MEKGYPLIIVFYLDRDTITNHDIMPLIANQVNETLASRESNAIAFFLPTDVEERVVCINPLQVSDVDMSKINTIVQDLIKNFDIGQGGDEGKNDEY
jgi:hypothetical protein